jgi:hypothetical protein
LVMTVPVNSPLANHIITTNGLPNEPMAAQVHRKVTVVTWIIRTLYTCAKFGLTRARNMDCLGINFYTPGSTVWRLSSRCTRNATQHLSDNCLVKFCADLNKNSTGGQTDGRAVVIQGVVCRSFGIVR